MRKAISLVFAAVTIDRRIIPVESSLANIVHLLLPCRPNYSLPCLACHSQAVSPSSDELISTFFSSIVLYTSYYFRPAVCSSIKWLIITFFAFSCTVVPGVCAQDDFTSIIPSSAAQEPIDGVETAPLPTAVGPHGI